MLQYPTIILAWVLKIIAPCARCYLTFKACGKPKRALNPANSSLTKTIAVLLITRLKIYYAFYSPFLIVLIPKSIYSGQIPIMEVTNKIHAIISKIIPDVPLMVSVK